MNKKKPTKKAKSNKNEDLKLELQEAKDKYIRLYSEFENYRRRTSKEKIEMIFKKPSFFLVFKNLNITFFSNCVINLIWLLEFVMLLPLYLLSEFHH